MLNELWLNLPVRDLEAAKAFYRQVGFKLHPMHENNPAMAGLQVGDKEVIVMLFPESTFKSFTQQDIADTSRGTEVLISVDAQSREEVDHMAQKVEAAGGAIFSPPQAIQGWMYGAGFTDLDGHRWNILYMDMSKMPS